MEWGTFFRAIIEISVIWGVFYLLYKAFKDSRAAAILSGLLILFIFLCVILDIMQAAVLKELGKLILGPGLLLVVLFQPELRTALARVGNSLARFGSRYLFLNNMSGDGKEFVQCMRDSVAYLVNKHYGALIAICRKNKLQEYVNSGTKVDALCSRELIGSIFMTKTLLHDGAMIINNERIVSAGAILPVSQRELQDRSMGLRHRAGIGLAETSDAVVIIVSEETGGVSLVVGGLIQRNISLDLLCERLMELLYNHVNTKRLD